MERRIIVENERYAENNTKVVKDGTCMDCDVGIDCLPQVKRRIVGSQKNNQVESKQYHHSHNDTDALVKDLASVTTGSSISPSVDCASGIWNCSDRKSRIVGRNTRKRSHEAKSNKKDDIVKDFALSHHTADFCKNEKFSLKAMEFIMKECLIAIGAQAVINPTSYKQLKKEIFDCIPYSDWFSPETFPTTLKLYHENNGFLF